MAQLLYIGSSNIEIITNFQYCNKFIFINTLPRSPIDDNIYDPITFKRLFTNDLISNFSEYGFELVEKKTIEFIFEKEEYANPTLLIFQNKSQIIKYYISTSIIHNMNPLLQKDIEECNGFIVKNFYPHQKILDYFIKPIDYYGFEQNIEGNDRFDNIKNFLNSTESTHFRRYFLVKNKNISEVEKSFFFQNNFKYFMQK